MTIAEFLKRFPYYQVSAEQLAFADYLERRGRRFLVDFGFENAEGQTWGELENELAN